MKILSLNSVNYTALALGQASINYGAIFFLLVQPCGQVRGFQKLSTSITFV